jgi:hypothetical protein
MTFDPNSIDDKFIDNDFVNDEHYVFGDLGAALFGDAQSYESAVPVIPKSQWPELVAKIDAAGGGAERLVTRIYNQGREGSCVANACCQAHEIVQARQFGKDKVVPLSAISLYKRIGRSPGSGAMVSDGLSELARRGALPLDTPANKERFGSAVMPATGFYTAFPSGWEATAKHFSGVEHFIVRSMEGLITALLNQHPVVVGRAGHSICYCRPVYRSGKLHVLYANSWGNWGTGAGDHKAGFGLDSEGYIRSSSSWAFALRSVSIPQV